MPHYVTQLDDQGHQFAVYSTVVDNLITPVMSGDAMRRHLVDREYTSWLTPPDDHSDLDRYKDSDPEHYKTIKEWRESTSQYMYWHSTFQFQFVKLSDAYFVLPEECWRYE